MTKTKQRRVTKRRVTKRRVTKRRVTRRPNKRRSFIKKQRRTKKKRVLRGGGSDLKADRSDPRMSGSRLLPSEMSELQMELRIAADRIIALKKDLPASQGWSDGSQDQDQVDAANREMITMDINKERNNINQINEQIRKTERHQGGLGEVFSHWEQSDAPMRQGFSVGVGDIPLHLVYSVSIDGDREMDTHSTIKSSTTVRKLKELLANEYNSGSVLREMHKFNVGLSKVIESDDSLLRSREDKDMEYADNVMTLEDFTLVKDSISERGPTRGPTRGQQSPVNMDEDKSLVDYGINHLTEKSFIIRLIYPGSPASTPDEYAAIRYGNLYI